MDCGGTCALVCKEATRPPVVLWSRAFRNSPNTYTLAAYVQNNNPGAGARHVGYTFQLFDAKNSLIIAHEGAADIPPVSIVPIIDPSVDVGNRVVARSIFSFSEIPSWDTVPKNAIPTLRIAGQELSQDGSRLSVKIENTSADDMGRLTVAAVLFGPQGIALAASKSTLPGIAAKTSQDVVFTWANGVPGVSRAEITLLPSF